MIRTTAALALAAALLATAASAGGKDPKTLALRKADFPNGAVEFPVPNRTVRGPLTSFYSVTFNFKRGGGEEEVTGYVSVGANASAAAGDYRMHVALNSGLPGTTVLKLPAHGDQQYAAWIKGPKRGGYSRDRAELVVRKGLVTWDLTVESCGPWAPYGCAGGTTPPNLTKAQAVAELRKYAAKQKTRVGRS
jgi:hypothetical protein